MDSAGKNTGAGCTLNFFARYRVRKKGLINKEKYGD